MLQKNFEKSHFNIRNFSTAWNHLKVILVRNLLAFATAIPKKLFNACVFTHTSVALPAFQKVHHLNLLI